LWAAFVVACARPRLAVWRFGSVLEASWESIRCAGLAGLAWVTLEWMRGWVFTGFGWNGLGVALHGNKTIIQAADLVGVSGLSFTPIFCSVILFAVVVRLIVQSQGGKRLRYHFDTLAAVALLVAQMLYGITKLKVEAHDTVPLRVALVQQNVPQRDIFTHENYEAHYRRYAELTQMMVQPRGESKTGEFDLVVWPESALALPWDAPAHAPFFDPLLALSDYSLLAGVDDRHVAGRDHTGAILMNKAFNGAQTYWKVHLVPFGEYLPMRWLLGPVLGGVLPGDFAPGEKIEPLPLRNSPVQVIPLVCFEDTVGDLARQFVRDEPQVLVNLTNDGWFLQSAEPEQHLNNAIFRAIELRRPLCRATNTGVTSFIDERGIVLSTLRDRDTGSTFIEGVLPRTVPVPRHPQRTLYVRWGDWFAMLGGAICLITLVLQWRHQRDTSHSAPSVQA
jgi:apolipoprotein N-acyltransferase